MSYERRVRELLAQELGIAVESITSGTRLENLYLDSLAMTEILVELESEFGIEISDEKASRFRTVEDVAKYLERELGM